jgi:outer membrane protein
VDDLSLKSARNNLKPNLALGGGYTTTGRGGTFYPRQITGGPVSTPIPGGLGDAFDQMFGFGFPIYNFSLTLNLPIRDRRAAADFADATIARKRDQLQLRSDQQQARLDVLTAVNQVENARASVRLAQIARDLAQKRAEAEDKKYQLGTSTIFLVLSAQNDLTLAESQLVTQSINYRLFMLTLLQRTGELLPERGLTLP